MSADGLGCLIAAVSSPHGHSFRGLLRATGEHLHEITAGIMRGEARQLLQERRRGVASGEILASLSGSDISIPCLVLSLPGPGSFTGEDSLEFELPGNPHLLAAVESALIQNANRSGYSAREAGPGEFSARAFLAGRIGLLEAEGIAALISARNDVELQAAQQLQANPLGTLSVELADRLTRILGLVEAGIDFSDEEQVVAMPVGTLRTELGAIIIQLQETLAHTHGSEATYGLPSVVLVGPPNAGKSTLFNALLGRPRMIVSNRAGTTRDTPAERCALREREIILVDTAGIDGAGGSEIEHKAQLATQRALRSSDLLIMCSPHDEEPITPASDWSTHQVLNVATRIDLAPGKPIPQGTCGVSGVDGTGLNDLRAAIEDRLSASTWASVESALRLLPRHLAALDLAHSALVAAIERLRRDAEDSGPSQAELLAEHIRVALNAIASLEGGGDPEEVLGVVFSSFCVGK